MALFTPPQDTTIINREIDSLQKYLRQLLADKEVLTEDLKGYETEGYESFKKVLEKEKIRIAMLRMEVDAGQVAQHDQLRGQFLEADMLMRNKENIERDISVHSRKILESQEKIEKLKKQLNKQIGGN